MSPFRDMVLKWSKTVSFQQFFANVRKTPKAIIAIYVYASEISRFTFLENGIGYCAISQSLEDIKILAVKVDEVC